MKVKMRWYVATLIMQSTRDDNAKLDEWMCEEQIRVIRAPDIDTAYTKAIKLGHAEEHSYPNVYGEMVHWKFIGLEDLDELEGTIRDGTELRYRFFNHKNPDSLVVEKDDLSVFAAAQYQEKLKRQKIIEESLPFEDLMRSKS